MAPGALVAVISGVYLSIVVMRSGSTPSAWLMLMQGAGLVAGLIVLFVLFPERRPTGQKTRPARPQPVRRAEEAAGDRGEYCGNPGLSGSCSEECLVSIEWKD